MSLVLNADPQLIAFIVAASAFLGFVGYRQRVVNKSGFYSGVLLALGLMVFFPLEWFAPLIVFVVVGGLASKYKHAYKKKHGEAEDKTGRSWKNVLGNGGVGLACAVLYGFTQSPVFLTAYLGSLASVCADTLAGEIGQLSKKKPVMITTLKPVRAGTDGGVSLLGQVGALVGAFLVSVTPLVFGFGSETLLIAGVLAGFLGSNVDSLIGATLERSKLVDKHGTNFLAALSGAVLIVLIHALL